MPRNVLQDVMTKEHRSIRHVPLPGGGRGRNGAEEEDSILYEREEYRTEETGPSSWRRVLLWGAASLFLVLLAAALSTSFTGATVAVIPKTELVSLSHEFTASTASDAKLRFETLPIRETSELVIPADTTKKMVTKASGTIVIYNAFSNTSQRLIKNTRFETGEGLIYRIGSSVTVPGKTVRDGRTIPGSIEAVVTADSPGTEYNIPLADFTVPGFRGDSARFAGFYARSKIPMKGGFDGMVKTPSEDALLSAREALQKTLREKVAKEAARRVPDGYILFDGSLSTKSEALPVEDRGNSLAAVKQQVTGAAYLFRKEDVVKAIAGAVLSKGNEIPVEIPEISTLVLALKDSAANPANVSTIRFTLRGNVRIVWLYDTPALKQALVGKPKGELTAVLSAFPTIEKVDLVLRPFWSRSFPDNPKKINIERAMMEGTPEVP